MSQTYSIPNIVSQSPRGDRIMDGYSHLLSERIIYLISTLYTLLVSDKAIAYASSAVYSLGNAAPIRGADSRGNS